MIGLPSGTRVWIVAGHTDMRKGFDGLAALVQTALCEPGRARTPHYSVARPRPPCFPRREVTLVREGSSQ